MLGVMLFLLVLAGWGGLSVFLSITGRYSADSFLALYPGLWLSFVPLLFAAATLGVRSVRKTFHQIVEHVPMTWFAGVQILRIAALGTLFKTAAGEFPVHVELAIGVTDLLFGLSAVFFSCIC